MGAGREIAQGAESLGAFNVLKKYFLRSSKTAEEEVKYPLAELRPKHRGEERFGVRYFNETERKKYLLTAKDGKLYDAEGKPFDTTARTAYGLRDAIFVMDKKGDIYAYRYPKSWKKYEGAVYHSSLVGGEPIAGGGELYVVDGVPKQMGMRCGHYWPTPEMNMNVYRRLKEMGVDVSQLRINRKFLWGRG